MKRYGYHRTSTREQHLDRGIKEITAYCEQNNLELEKIFTDQQTGKNLICAVTGKAILPSSLTMLLPPALGFSPHPPVSVYGTGTV